MDLSFLQRALDAAAAGTVITDRNGVIEWVNAGFTRITGYSPDEVIGRTPRVLRSPAHTPSFYSQLWETIQSGRSWRGTFLNRHKDGKLYSSAQTIAPVLNDAGEITHFIGIMQETGPGKALQESEDRYYSLIEKLGDGVLSSTPDGQIRMANPAAATALGFPRDMLLGRNLRDFAHPADIPIVQAELKRRLRGEKSVYEFRIVRPDDGAVRTIQVTATPEFDSAGNFRGSLGIFRDVTAEREMEHRIRLLAHTLESVDELVVICGPDDHVLFVNRAFTRAYGYEESELLGQHISVVRSPLDTPEVTSHILPATLTGGWRGELWNRRKDGTDFLILLTTAAVKDDAGRLQATVGVGRDITEAKRVEAELTRAKEEAERANRAKSEFLATISHEIRTPMNGVIGMTSLLLDTKLDATQRDYAETVQQSADALMSIINDILDFSRIEARRLKIEETPFDLQSVIEGVIGILMPKARSTGLALVAEYAATLPREFVGDPGKIRQVLMNLVSNALKFTERGEVRVSISCVGLDSQVAGMRVAVRDTGMGIPQDKLELVFEKFSQVDSSNTRRHGGTGLGLAIAKELIAMLGGAIGVESQVGQGSTFWFTLPLRLALPRSGAQPAGSRASDDGVGSHMRVLLAEDNLINQKVAAGMLQRLGLRTDVAATGVEAVERCGQLAYDLVFMDCQMPQMDGYRAAMELRRREGSIRRMVIIALTADARSGTRERCIEAGMDDCIVKPVKLEDLRQAIEKWAPRLA
jgi:PAS domain S-box-containing protein